MARSPPCEDRMTEEHSKEHQGNEGAKASIDIAVSELYWHTTLSSSRKVAMNSTSRRTSPSRFESLSAPTISTTARCRSELKPARICPLPSFRSSQTAFLSRSLSASSSAPSSCPVPLPFCALPKPSFSQQALHIHSRGRRMGTYGDLPVVREWRFHV